MKPFNYNRNLLFSGLLFTIHNIEEAFGTACFILPKGTWLAIELPDTKPMIWSIVLITIIGWSIVFWAMKQSSNSKKLNVLTFFLLLFIINAFIPHIIATLVLQMYTPALVTSVLLYIPYALWGLPKMYRQYVLKRHFYLVLFAEYLLHSLLLLLYIELQQ